MQNSGQVYSGRLIWLDALHAMALLIVLVDHIDMYAGNMKVFMSWTPIAWGYSDASEYSSAFPDSRLATSTQRVSNVMGFECACVASFGGQPSSMPRTF